MALRTLVLNKKLAEKRSALAALEAKTAEFEKREQELAASIEEATTDEEKAAVEAAVDEFDQEKKDAEEAKAGLRSEIEGIEKELKDIEDAAPAEPTERGERNMAGIITRDSEEYVDAFARYIKTGKADEVRTLLTENVTNGTVAVPTFVEGIIRTAWETDAIMSRVRKTNLPGNLEIGFEISGTDAEEHTEGADAIDEEELVLGIVSLKPSNIKKWIRITTEVMDLAGEEFVRYIYAEIAHKIIVALSAKLVGLIKALPTTATSTSVSAPKITAAPSLGTVAEALASLSPEAVNPVIIMNRKTWGAFKVAQYAGNYPVDPFEGLPVLYSDALPAYSAATAGNVYMVVGDLGYGAHVNYPKGEDIKFVFDEFTEAEADLVKIVGRQYSGVNAVAVGGFVNVAKPTTV